MVARSILAVFNGYDHELSGLNTAIALAKASGGHVRVLHVNSIAQSYAGIFGEASVAGMGWEEEIERQNEARLANARKMTEAVAEREGLTLDATATEGPSLFFVSLRNAYNRTLLRELSLVDLIVTSSEKGVGDILSQSVTDLALFSSRRPVLVVRPSDNDAPATVTGAPAVVAWNDSPEAMHALVNAAPLLGEASRVHLVTTEKGSGTEVPEDQKLALAYLAAHGIEAMLHVVDTDGRQAGEAVLAKASELSAGYVVMGAYGHSVLRESLVGGFSEYMLGESDLPLLLSH
ncbi:universal stress protein [Acuticoccus mangrovi]|uniref:Universal stress protein n=1 Tax=Acuticoccus mangrovi TaxID=2796142 RepID=A0A934IUK6_9HYPH|nr:universal stress protein [Acuticoccus mangrovi]MBJ3778014.1 universal stress protein [Acuticoccus mangrovi]